RWRYSWNPAGLCDRLRTNTAQFLHDLARETRHVGIVQLRWNPFGLGLPQLLDFAFLLLQIPFVLNTGFERNHVFPSQGLCFYYAIGNQFFQMNLRPAQETAECWSLAKFDSRRDEEWVGRVHTQLLDRTPQPFDSCATLQILLPMVIAYKTYTAANRRQPRIRVVDPQIKPELRTRS